MIEVINFEGDQYPAFQASGNASQFAIPFAKHICKGIGVDIGFCRDEWKFPGAIGADLSDDTNLYHAANLPSGLDYIYSSHCLEHVDDWVEALRYWVSCLKKGGVIFLYLPHPNQKYWKPWNNRKHKHTLYIDDIVNCLKKFGIDNIINSEMDLNHSYIVAGSKT
jgi:SAM-dependent methyltransferase